MGAKGHKQLEKTSLITRETYREFKRIHKPKFKDLSKAEWMQDCTDLLDAVVDEVISNPYGIKLPNNLGWLSVSRFKTDDKNLTYLGWYKSMCSKDGFWSGAMWKFKPVDPIKNKLFQVKDKSKYNYYSKGDFGKIRKIL